MLKLFSLPAVEPQHYLRLSTMKKHPEGYLPDANTSIPFKCSSLFQFFQHIIQA